MNGLLIIGAGIVFGVCGGALWFRDARQSAGSNNERRKWAKAQGYSYARKNQHLIRDWSFLEQTGAARDVVSGSVRDVDFYITDIGECTFVGIRRGDASRVSVQAIRANALDSIETPLERVLYTSGFAVVSNDAGAAERFVDERVDAALEALESAEYIWIDGEWVVGQVSDEMASVQPLTLLAEAARALPPAVDTPLDFENGNATRALPARLEVGSEPEVLEDHSGPTLHVVADPDSETVESTGSSEGEETAKINESTEAQFELDESNAHELDSEHSADTDFAGAEPYEPEPMFEPELPRPKVDLPSRSVSETRGHLPAHMVGGDAVDSIGDRGYAPSEEDYISPKVARDLSKGSSIFDDLSDELGITVDGKNKGDKNVEKE
ncbi:hypothetical protein CFREI_12540 [Corynebacterium freiburgense]|nr:hypothetical protein CFREI_12540 [Corynebacterium freiburgense]